MAVFPLQEYQPCAHTPALPWAPQCAWSCPCSPSSERSPRKLLPRHAVRNQTTGEQLCVKPNPNTGREGWQGPGCPPPPTGEVVLCQTKGSITHISARVFSTSPHEADRQKGWSIYLLFPSQKHKQGLNPRLSKLISLRKQSICNDRQLLNKLYV